MRADARGQYGLLSTRQWISLGMVVVSVAILIYRMRGGSSAARTT